MKTGALESRFNLPPSILSRVIHRVTLSHVIAIKQPQEMEEKLICRLGSADCVQRDYAREGN
jgi:hypothetical protein